MKYRLVADNPIEEQLFSSPVAPLPVLEPLLPLLQGRAIMAGVRLEIFEAIGQEVRTAAEVAEDLSLDSQCLDLLLRVLTSAGYVQREGHGYRLTDLTRSTLLSTGVNRLAGWVDFLYYNWEIIGQLERVLRTGEGLDAHATFHDSQFWARYQRAMLEVARIVAPLVAGMVPVRQGATRLVDIGGAHGLYGAMICRQHKPMTSTVLDLPQAAEHAVELARVEGIGDLVQHRPCNVLVDDLGAGYDVAFIGNTLHHFSADQGRDLLARVHTALVPEGTVAIWDTRLPEDDDPADLAGDGFALFYRLTSTAQCYRRSDYLEWIRAAGFDRISVHDTPFAPMQLLITGRKQA